MNKTQPITKDEDVTPTISNSSTANIINNEEYNSKKSEENTNNVPNDKLITVEPKLTKSLSSSEAVTSTTIENDGVKSPSTEPPPPLTVIINSEISSSSYNGRESIGCDDSVGVVGSSGFGITGEIIPNGTRGHGVIITETGEKLPRKSSLKKRVHISEKKEIIKHELLPAPIEVPSDNNINNNTLIDDDEVFSDSVPSPLPRSDWCVSWAKKGDLPGFVDLPYWFNTDGSGEERGGNLEPPNTPIGRDELALKRHRFFSDLRTAAEAASEHRVRFDPLGPFFSELTANATAALDGILIYFKSIGSMMHVCCCCFYLHLINLMLFIENILL